MSKKITALGSTVCVALAIGLVGAAQIGTISFEKGAICGLICVLAATMLQRLGK